MNNEKGITLKNNEMKTKRLIDDSQLSGDKSNNNNRLL